MTAPTTTKRDLRLSLSQDAALETAANVAGMDVQAFVRYVLSQHVSGFVDELPRRKTHGKRVGARKRKAVQS